MNNKFIVLICLFLFIFTVSSVSATDANQTVTENVLTDDIGTFSELQDIISNTEEGSIVNYENTYLQNSGLTYSSNSKFDVIAIMDGEVTKIYNNEVLGNIIEITHENDIVSIYQVLDNITVKEHDKVKKGDKIAESGTSKIYNTNYNLHFEILKNGNIQNPNTILGKNTKEI